MDKWALFNILLSFATGIIALLSVSRRKDKDLQPFELKKVHIAKGIALEIGIVSCLVCLFSEQPQISENFADKWSIVLTILLFGEIMADYFVNKKCHPKN